MTQAYVIIALVGAGVVLLGSAFFVVGRGRHRSTRSWTTTTGMVVQRDGSTTGVPATYPTFAWRDDTGREHQLTSDWEAVPGPRPGQLVTVRYDPQDPSNGIIDSAAQNGSIIRIIGIVIMVLGVVGAVLAGLIAAAVDSALPT